MARGDNVPALTQRAWTGAICGRFRRKHYGCSRAAHPKASERAPAGGIGLAQGNKRNLRRRDFLSGPSLCDGKRVSKRSETARADHCKRRVSNRAERLDGGGGGTSTCAQMLQYARLDFHPQVNSAR